MGLFITSTLPSLSGLVPHNLLSQQCASPLFCLPKVSVFRRHLFQEACVYDRNTLQLEFQSLFICLFVFVSMAVLPEFISVYHVYTVAMEARRGSHIP